ncbi:MAG: hypothetical protein ABIH66_11935 [bacterium]
MSIFKSAIEDFMSKNAAGVWKVLGRVINATTRTPAGEFLVTQSSKLAGAAVAGMGLYGIQKSGDVRQVAEDFARVMGEFGWDFEFGNSTEDEVEIFMLDCPGKLEGEEACLAGMEADVELVRRLGAKLEIHETIATGADRCRLTVVRP